MNLEVSSDAASRERGIKAPTMHYYEEIGHRHKRTSTGVVCPLKGGLS